jgi:copper homeostasis protein (lipoprotein)
MGGRILVGLAIVMLSAGLSLGCSGEKNQSEDEQSQGTDVTLLGTYWKLTELKGKTVNAQPDQEEIHIRLRDDEPRVGGFSGCNRFMGSFELDGEALRFGELASTMMACPNLDEEQKFLQAMAEVTMYEISKETLEFRSDSETVARFTAMYREQE